MAPPHYIKYIGQIRSHEDTNSSPLRAHPQFCPPRTVLPALFLH